MIRTTRPTSGNKYFIRRASGGYSTCIQGKPTDSQCDVLSNCVGYACGAYNEELNLGYEKYHLNCNAENFIERAIASGLSIYKTPHVGDIICWEGKGSLAGHVGIVIEVVNSNCIKVAQSGYGSSTPFYITTNYNNNGRWGLSENYPFRGFIENQNYKHSTSNTNTNTTTDPFPNVSDEELAKRVWTGEFGNGEERRKKLGSRYNAVQALVDKGVGKPSSTPSTPTTSEPKKQYDLLTMVKKTIRGDFGNYPQRKTEIEKLGYDYKQVQDQVNANINHGLTRWDNIKLF